METNEKEKLSDKITMDILEMITVQKCFQPGDKLPNEIDLALELGVSRTTLREAENNLAAQGILERRRGKGTFVAENKKLTDDMGFDDLNYIHTRLADLYELRMMMEPPMAGLAAVKATDEEIDFIASCGSKIEEQGIDSEKIMEYNRQFHNAIAKATHNEFLIRLFDNINQAIVNGFQVENKEQMNNEDMIRSHKMITEYMKLRDSEGACQAMKLHLKYSIKDFKIEI